MDNIASMIPYLEQAKENINIVNRIYLECLRIDINLGFIGYKDYINYANYINIEFTQNYETLKNSLNSIKMTTNTDYPEDLEGRIELAFINNWKNNARFSIIIADAPCHGTKYHNMKDNYPNGNPYRKNIEILIKEFAEKKFLYFVFN